MLMAELEVVNRRSCCVRNYEQNAASPSHSFAADAVATQAAVPSGTQASILRSGPVQGSKEALPDRCKAVCLAGMQLLSR